MLLGDSFSDGLLYYSVNLAAVDMINTVLCRNEAPLEFEDSSQFGSIASITDNSG